MTEPEVFAQPSIGKLVDAPAAAGARPPSLPS